MRMAFTSSSGRRPGVELPEVSSRKLSKNEQCQKQQNRRAHERERKPAPPLVNHSAQHRQENTANQAPSGGDGTPRKPAERFPSCGHACPSNHYCTDAKYEKRANRKPKKPGHDEMLICVIYREKVTSASQVIHSLSSPQELRAPLLLVLFNSKYG